VGCENRTQVNSIVIDEGYPSSSVTKITAPTKPPIAYSEHPTVTLISSKSTLNKNESAIGM
jgi:hypothetical protein